VGFEKDKIIKYLFVIIIISLSIATYIRFAQVHPLNNLVQFNLALNAIYTRANMQRSVTKTW